MSSRQSNQFPIPETFPEILHNFAKEIVRYQPNDIYDFSIQYFHCLENEIPLNYTPGASSNIQHQEDKNKESIIEDNNTNKNNNNNSINNEDVNYNINENTDDDNIDEHYEKKAKEFIDDVLKKSFQFVQNSQEINENKIENEEDEKSINKNNSEDNNTENNEMNQMILSSENNEEGNEENVILGKTVMNTQGSESNSRAFSASSVSNNSEIRRTAHQFIGDVLKNGREDAKKNQDII